MKTSISSGGGMWSVGAAISTRRAAYELVNPDNISLLRAALLVAPWTDTEGVFTELRKQLEDQSALFFEIPPSAVRWDQPAETDLFDLVPGGGLDEHRGSSSPSLELHWVEIVCLSAQGGVFAGARVRVRLPGGRSETATLDAHASVRFDDLSEGGTVHFELSGDAVARGGGAPAVGTGYTLGRPMGLLSGRRHVLIVHPNPDAFVAVDVWVDGEAVVGGSYTLLTKLGEQGGTINAEPARAEGFVLPSAATYSFKGVVLPPRTRDDDRPDDDDPDPRPDGPDGPDGPLVPDRPERPDDPDGPDDPVPVGPVDPPVAPTEVGDALRVRVMGAEDAEALVEYDGGRIEARIDAEGVLEIELPAGVREVTLLLPTRAERYTFELGPLPPATAILGASIRLRNLGLFTGAPTEENNPPLRDAVGSFQKMRGLAVTGEVDARTAEALEAEYGS